MSLFGPTFVAAILMTLRTERVSKSSKTRDSSVRIGRKGRFLGKLGLKLPPTAVTAVGGLPFVWVFTHSRALVTQPRPKMAMETGETELYENVTAAKGGVPRVSVVVPSYNHALFVERAL